MRLNGIALAACALAGCALGPDYQAPAPSVAGVPAAWRAPLPHRGEVADLAQWWTRFEDPVLTGLILAAQRASPTLALAEARVRAASAAVQATGAALAPRLDGTLSATRANLDQGPPFPGTNVVQDSRSANAALAWEIDLFGRNQRSLEGSVARQESSQAAWHDARVVVAAGVASTYVARRQCEALLAFNQVDLDSRVATDRLTRDRVQAGFSPPADLLRTDASVASAAAAMQDIRATCERTVNQLVALTGLSYAEIAAQLAPGAGAIPEPTTARIAAIPADAIAQRPDVAAAERELAAASADIGVAIADRFPRLALSGSITSSRVEVGAVSGFAHPWSFGPALTLPLFDAGLGAARVDAARAQYDAALAAYQLKVRQAVQEVEDALVRVDAADARVRDAERSDAQNQRYFASREAQYRLGAANLLELEDARRLTVISMITLAGARQERAQAWIALYQAVGGGWQPIPNPSTASASATPPRPGDRP